MFRRLRSCGFIFINPAMPRVQASSRDSHAAGSTCLLPARTARQPSAEPASKCEVAQPHRVRSALNTFAQQTFFRTPDQYGKQNRDSDFSAQLQIALPPLDNCSQENGCNASIPHSRHIRIADTCSRQSRAPARPERHEYDRWCQPRFRRQFTDRRHALDPLRAVLHQCCTHPPTVASTGGTPLGTSGIPLRPNNDARAAPQRRHRKGGNNKHHKRQLRPALRPGRSSINHHVRPHQVRPHQCSTTQCALSKTAKDHQ